VAELTEDQILQKAKELCHNDGKAWDRDDFADMASRKTALSEIADDSDRTESLNIARIASKWESPRSPL